METTLYVEEVEDMLDAWKSCVPSALEKPGTHAQYPGATHMERDGHGVEHIGMVQSCPSHPSAQEHVSGATHVPENK